MAAQLKPDALALLKKVVAAAEGTAPSTDGTAGADMVGPKKSKKGAHRAKPCKSEWEWSSVTLGKESELDREMEVSDPVPLLFFTLKIV